MFVKDFSISKSVLNGQEIFISYDLFLPAVKLQKLVSPNDVTKVTAKNKNNLFGM